MKNPKPAKVVSVRFYDEDERNARIAIRRKLAADRTDAIRKGLRCLAEQAA